MGVCHLDELLAQREGERRPCAQARDPDTIDLAEFAELFRQCDGDEYREIGADRALVLLELG